MLADFRVFLKSTGIGRKGDSEDKQIAEDVSKYLYYANNQVIQPLTIIKNRHLNDYTKKLFDEGVGIEGAITKLYRMFFFF